SVLAIGLMSGTSQDGVDMALIDSDGERIAQLGATAFRPYGKTERTLPRRAPAAAANLTERSARPGVVGQAERLVNDAHAEAVESFLTANGALKGPESVDCEMASEVAVCACAEPNDSSTIAHAANASLPIARDLFRGARDERNKLPRSARANARPACQTVFT